MNKKIVMLFNCPVVEGFIKKYCLDEIVALGYDFRVIDLSSVLEKEYEKNTKANVSFPTKFPIIKFYTYKEVKNFIKENAKDSLFLPMFDFIFTARKIFYYFSLYRVEYGYVNNLLSPLFAPAQNNKLVIKSYKFSYKYIRSALFHRVWRKILPFKRANFMCFGGTNGKKFCLSEGACNKKTRQIDLYTFDFENFLFARDIKQSTNYCVFIDQYIPFHPDNVVHGGLKINPDVYYKELEILLDAIGKKYNLEIVISAHPQANYNQLKYFEKYRIEYGKTAELVKNSQLVCTHFSTAVIYGIMAKKKIILLNNKSLSQYENMQNAIQKIQTLINCDVLINEEEIINSYASCYVDNEIYEQCMAANIAIKQPNGDLLWKRVFAAVFNN